jgi:uncharacterized protein YggE
MRSRAWLGPIAAVVVMLAPAAVAHAAPATLHVIGSGRVLVTPDLATVTITTDRAADSRVLARRRVNSVISRMVAGLIGAGFDRLDIQTSNITLNTTVVPARKRRRAHKVYDAEIDLTVTARRVSLLSPLFDIASRSGADSFVGPNFGFSNPSAGMVDATSAALQDARSRADAAAAQLGMHVSGVQSVDISPQSAPLPATGAPGSSTAPTKVTAPVPTPVLPGRQQVDAQADVVFLLSS